jgi:RNA polymerase sigma-70 factor (ECF subfamily)
MADALSIHWSHAVTGIGYHVFRAVSMRRARARDLWHDHGVAVDPLRHLLEAAQEGDDRALAELVRRTDGEVRRTCIALSSAADADDLVQDTYLRAMRAIGGFRGDSSVLTWLLAIARHACADYVRVRTRQRRLHDRLVAQPPEAQVEAAEPIAATLLKLDADRREAFVLTQLYGLSYAEAADVLDCPIGTVRSRVARARIDLAGIVAVDGDRDAVRR